MNDTLEIKRLLDHVLNSHNPEIDDLKDDDPEDDDPENDDPDEDDEEDDDAEEDEPEKRPFLFDPVISARACKNPAIAGCCNAWRNTYDAALAQGKEGYEARHVADEAYRNALPPLAGADNIRDFIACTGHGMLIGAIDGSKGARLLYAAQVAHGSRRHKSAGKKPLKAPNKPANEPNPGRCKCAQVTSEE